MSFADQKLHFKSSPQNCILKKLVLALSALLRLMSLLKLRICKLQDMAAANAPQEADDTHVSAWKQDSGESQSHLLPSKISEVARFGALKEKKHSLEAGIALFNG